MEKYKLDINKNDKPKIENSDIDPQGYINTNKKLDIKAYDLILE